MYKFTPLLNSLLFGNKKLPSREFFVGVASERKNLFRFPALNVARLAGQLSNL